MKTLKVTNRETGKVDFFDMDYVKSYCRNETIEAMRAHKDHKHMFFMIEFDERMPYGLAMYEVDKYDMVIE